MELLVITMAHIAPGRDADGLARARLIADTIGNAPGLMTRRFYRSGEQNSSYLLLTSWEDEKLWQKAQERYNPKQLLLESVDGLLAAPPDQWFMHYLWGYSRPSASQDLAAAHLATIQSEAAEHIQQGWIESLRRLAVEPTLAFAFLARSVDGEVPLSQIASAQNNTAMRGSSFQKNPLFLNLLSWPNETCREEFYADPNYKAISGHLSSAGVVRVMMLEPV